MAVCVLCVGGAGCDGVLTGSVSWAGDSVDGLVSVLVCVLGGVIGI